MSARLAEFMVAAAIVIAGTSPAHSVISNDEFDDLYYSVGYNCSIGRELSRNYRRQVRVCNKYSTRIDRIMRRCKLRLPENSYACARLVQYRHIDRYPPPDPRKRRE